MKDTEYEKYLEKRQEETGDIIQKLCWDQDRFIRGYTEAGDRIGAAKDPEANLWLNPQSWSVISGLAAADQADTALIKYGIWSPSDESALSCQCFRRRSCRHI